MACDPTDPHVVTCYAFCVWDRGPHLWDGPLSVVCSIYSVY